MTDHLSLPPPVLNKSVAYISAYDARIYRTRVIDSRLAPKHLTVMSGARRTPGRGA
jgi:hypothetical protein